MRRLLRITVALLGLFRVPECVGQIPWTGLSTPGSDSDDRARLAYLLGRTGAERFLVRSATDTFDTLSGSSAVTGLRWGLVAPEVVAIRNTALPFSLNDGSLWAGRGWSQRARAGFRLQWGRVSVVVVPELVANENLPYALPPPEVQLPRPVGRDSLSTPWHVGAHSIDLPLRFGTRGQWRLEPGQTTVAVGLGGVDIGLSTGNEWWGPGIRNGIVMSTNAAGIPRAFVRTSRPWRTRVGTFSARWFLGGLAESRFFDDTGANDRRAITGFAATWTPGGAPNLTFGFTRVVYAPLSSWNNLLSHTFDVVRDRQLRSVPGGGRVPTRDQIFSLFGRWAFPADGFAVHFEWARTDPPRSLRDLLTSPNHSQGYTLGLEWARPVAGDGAIRVQGELTYLEMPSSYRNVAEKTFYTSAVASQGYTQRGQVIGAAIGPGASSQWLGLDYVRPRWRMGLFGGRIRWDDDALYLFPETATQNKKCSHDISLFAGVSAALEGRWGSAGVSLTRGKRLNVFYHHLTTCDPHPDPQLVRDVGNTTLELRFSPR